MSNITSTSVITSNEMLRPSSKKEKPEKTEQEQRFCDALAEANNMTVAVPYVRSRSAITIRGNILECATNDPEWAKRAAHSHAHSTPGGPPIGMADLPVMKLWATGELYTDKMRRYFEPLEENLQREMSALYTSEIAKGTPPLEILKQMLAQEDAMPDEFKRMADI